MIELNKVIEGGFKSLTEVFEASIVVQRQYVEVRKGDVSVYSGMLEQARVIAAQCRNLFEAKGLNDPNATWYTFAADQWQAMASQEVAQGSVKGYTDAEMALFNRYVKELYDAMSANAPLLEDDDKTGKPVLGGRSAVAKWMKDYREQQQQKQREASAAAAKLLGVNLAGDTAPAQPTATGGAESGSVLDQIQDAEVRAALEEYIREIADVCKAGHPKVALGSVKAGITAMSRHLTNSVQKGFKALKNAANG